MTQAKISRRDLLKSSAAITTSSMLSACGGGNGSSSGNKPNILFIMVDEMRYPKVFPTGISDAGAYLRQYMPNTYKLWAEGVKFANYNTAATACSPSRGVILTGLYSHQTWFGTTLVVIPGASHADSPSLQSDFPTYGKLLRNAGYITPYVGKWHLSQSSGGTQDISAYGFQGLTYPDPIGNNLQGTYGDLTSDPNYLYYSDEYIATQAATWLGNKQVGDQPWCLTVGFQNPHDQEFFPAGTEYQTYTNLFNGSGYAQNQNWSTASCAAGVSWSNNALRNPPQIYTIATPPNWETVAQLQQNKPKAQIFNREFCEAEWGGINESTTATSFSVVKYPGSATTYAGYTAPTVNGVPVGIGLAPYSYWQKALNLYTYLLNILDVQIGRVLDALPAEVAKNTVVVFTSDHGDYVGAHGMVAGKMNSMYDEALRVPLIVKDPTGTFTGDISSVRTQLTSSVDLMPMLVGLAYAGNKSAWMVGDYAEMYGDRYDMFPILKSNGVAGRDYALFATDEVAQSKFDFVTNPNGATDQGTPVHIMGVITTQYKLGVYSRWPAGTTDPSAVEQQYEYYDYATSGGQQETDNTYGTADSVRIKNNLMDVLVPTVLQKPLPLAYQVAQQRAKEGLVAFNLLDQASGRE